MHMAALMCACWQN